MEERKMSGTLKKHITIKNILERYNARQIRFVFLLNTWSSLINFSDENTFTEAVTMQESFSEFFRNVMIKTQNIDVKSS